MPLDDGRRPHDGKCIGPARPRARQDDPEGSVDRAKLGARLPTPEHSNLLTKGEILDDETCPRPKARA